MQDLRYAKCVMKWQCLSYEILCLVLFLLKCWPVYSFVNLLDVVKIMREIYTYREKDIGCLLVYFIFVQSCAGHSYKIIEHLFASFENKYKVHAPFLFLSNVLRIKFKLSLNFLKGQTFFLNTWFCDTLVRRDHDIIGLYRFSWWEDVNTRNHRSFLWSNY